jgi:hypothetical protein
VVGVGVRKRHRRDRSVGERRRKSDVQMKTHATHESKEKVCIISHAKTFLFKQKPNRENKREENKHIPRHSNTN